MLHPNPTALLARQLQHHHFSQRAIMHAFLLSIVALVFCLPVAAAADESCACHFPTKMKGEVSIFIDDYSKGGLLDLLQPEYSAFEVDFDVKRVRIWPPHKEFKGYSEYIQDLENNTMYRFPFLDDGSKGPCTFINFTEDIRIPNCLPAGWILKTLDGENLFSKTGTPESDFVNEYYMHVNDLCQPIDIFHLRRRNATTEVQIEVEVDEYNIRDSPNFFPNTSSCTEASFDSFLKEYIG